MLRTAALLAALALAAPLPGATAAIYAGGPLYAGGAAVMDDLRCFDTVVAWTLHVDAEGGLIFNDQPIVAGGRYTGDPLWPERLAGLKRAGPGRLLFAVGSAGVDDFHHVQALIQGKGAGLDNPLRRNFQALKRAIPAIDGFDLDDEDLLDAATTKAFSRMLGGLGCAVSFCPYDNMGFWVDCLRDLETSAPGLVTGFHLQCYAGGAWNRPRDWMDAIGAALGPGFDARGMVQPGLWSRHGDGCQEGDGPDGIEAQFQAWKPDGVRGGFIWLYDDIQRCRDQGSAGAYARAVTGGLRN